jgi:hypothetical protein
MARNAADAARSARPKGENFSAPAITLRQQTHSFSLAGYGNSHKTQISKSSLMNYVDAEKFS